MLNVNEAEKTLRVDLAAAFYLAVANNLHEAIANHFSAILPDAQHFLVNPFGLHFPEITASNLLVCDFDCKVVATASHHHRHITSMLRSISSLPVPASYCILTSLTRQH
jgi:ribulose-5-phosphate 4-epimerase/fuculose-1-phosphate aldolase